MSQIEDEGPIRPEFPTPSWEDEKVPFEYPFSKEKELKIVAEDFYFLLGSSIKEPKKLEHLFQHLVILMCIADSGFLSQDEEKWALDEVKKAKEDLQNGSITHQDLFERLDSIIKHLNHNNPRSKIISIITEFEYFFTMYPPEGLEPVNNEHFQNIMNPFHAKINSKIEDFEVTPVARHLEHFKEIYMEDPKATFQDTLDQLEKYGKELS